MSNSEICIGVIVAIAIIVIIGLCEQSKNNKARQDACQELVEPYASRIVDDKCYRLDENGNLILLSEKYEKN